MKPLIKRIFTCFTGLVFLAACIPARSMPTATNTRVVLPTQTVTNTPMPAGLWIAPGVPLVLRNIAESSNVPLVNDPQLATQKLNISESGSAWIYTLVAPFPTVTDDILYADLLSNWKGTPAGPLAGRALLMDESTLAAFTVLWGAPAPGSVRSVPANMLLDTAWAEMPAWAIMPFEEVQPKWKVLSVDGQSPIRKDFDPETYRLRIHFALDGSSSVSLPETNRDPAKLTTVVLTGVTALVRATALTMEMKGVTYPGSLVGDWLREADIAHISNEVTFDPECGYPKFSSSLVLCSDPKYMDLLLDVGTDVVEVTGDHLLDRSFAALTGTFATYKEHGIPYYGGGVNAEEARLPVLMEVNGNKIAFMGCNGKPEIFQKATGTTPGPAECDYPFFVDQIQSLKAQGYMVIFTFQHNECYSASPCYYVEDGFHIVADAGSTVVSGSQAHFPHSMAFRGDSFIHYGLGNLFFDQMRYTLPDGSVIDGTRLEFLDRHVFYDGRYLGVELLTARLEDYARPRPMTPDERAAFLLDYFYYSGFIPFSPTPVPQPTVTLTPIALP
jgi:hypothetical protein